MAVVADRVIVELEAKLDRYNANVLRAERQFTGSMVKIDGSARRTEATTSGAFRNIAAAFFSIQAARGAAALIDANTRIQNSLKVAGLEGAELSRVYDELFSAAQRNAAPIGALATLYGRAAQAQKELGATSADLTSFTENVAKALRVSGTTAEQAQGALLQLGQALGSARVMAEEFNSINEGARPILQAAAAGIEEAAGSVAKLKQLVNDGKVSNKAFFDGIQAGAYILDNQLAGSEVTISQAFIRLQNVLIDTAGTFDQITNASGILTGILGGLADAIQAVGDAFDRALNPGQALVDDLASRVNEAAAEVRQFAEQSKGVFSPEVEAAFQDLINQVIAGKGNIELAHQALAALGDADPNFDIVEGDVSGLVTLLYTLRGAAETAKASLDFSDIGRFPTAGELANLAKPPTPPVTLANYPILGGGGSKKTPQQNFEESLQSIRDKTAALGLEQEALNQTTLAAERAKIAQDLLNEARDAGVAITPQVKASIDEVAEAYAQAAASLEQTKKLQQEFTEIATGALTGFINDLREGKSAAEALANVFDSLANKLIDIAVQGLVEAAFGGLFGGGGGGIGSLLGGLFGGRRANGGSVQAGKAYMVGERGPEPFIPSVSGRIIPNHAMGGSSSGGQTKITLEVAEGAAFSTRVLTVSGPQSVQITKSGIEGYDQSSPSRRAEQNARYM